MTYKIKKGSGWTKARMIELIRRHVPEEGSLDEAGTSCVYQNEDGRRCAVGALLPDDAAFDDLDEGSVFGSGIPNETGLDFLDDSEWAFSLLQSAHDDAAFARQGGADHNVTEVCVKWIEENIEDAN